MQSDGVELVAALDATPAPGTVVVAWRWPDTRIWPDDGPPEVPPPVAQAPLEPVRLEVRSSGDGRVRFALPDDALPHDTWVTRLAADEPAPVGARQWVYRGFSLRCEELGLLAFAGAACTRLPLDDGFLVAVEWAHGDESCVRVEWPGGRRRPRCRTFVEGEGPRADEIREHLAAMAFSSGAGPSSPEAWFRADGEVLVLLNRFDGPNQRRCLAVLDRKLREFGCVAGPPLGSF